MRRRVLLGVVAVTLLAAAFWGGYTVGTNTRDARVPNLLGLGTDGGGQLAARRALVGVGLRVGKVGWKVCAADERGLVVHQYPPAGAVVPSGATVNINIGTNGRSGFFGEPKQCLPGEQQPARG